MMHSRPFRISVAALASLAFVLITSGRSAEGQDAPAEPPEDEARSASAPVDNPLGLDALVAVRGGDPLDFALAVQRGGESHVYDALSGTDTDGEADEHEDEVAPTPRQQIAIVSAAPFVRAPERTLEGLATLAAGRDPDVAPAAMASAATIARGLSFHTLQLREVEPSALTPARERFAALAADEAARGDIRGLAAATVEAIAHLQADPEVADSAY